MPTQWEFTTTRISGRMENGTLVGDPLYWVNQLSNWEPEDRWRERVRLARHFAQTRYFHGASRIVLQRWLNAFDYRYPGAKSCVFLELDYENEQLLVHVVTPDWISYDSPQAWVDAFSTKTHEERRADRDHVVLSYNEQIALYSGHIPSSQSNLGVWLNAFDAAYPAR